MEDDDLYDAYLDRVLDGTAEDPAAFLAAHPEAGPELRARIAGLHRMAVEPGDAASAGGGGASPTGDRGAATAADAATTPPPPRAPDVPWERLGGYRLLQRIGTGGMGAVFLAEDEALRRPVALKVVRPDLAGSAVTAERFRREAQAVARLRHPALVTLYGAGEDGGIRWLAMEFVPGRGLDEVLAQSEAGDGRVRANAVRWAAQIARGLAVAHGQGIVHRDVKPSNVRVTPDGRAMLLDFGVARDTASDAPTLTGPFVGSPVYAAPEQVAGGAVDGRTDVYGLGATLYECLGGQPPHEGGTMEAVLRRVLAEEPVPLRRRNPSVSRELAVVVAKAMEKDPARRYASAAEFADDLEAVLSFRPIRARPPGPAARAWKWTRRNPATAAAAATGVLAVVGAAVWFVADDVARTRAARREAAAAVGEARTRIEEYRRRREETAAIEGRVRKLREEMETLPLTPEETRLLTVGDRDIDAARRLRETAYHEVLELLRRAERLDPQVAGTQDTRAELYLEKWREARTLRDRAAEPFWRDLVRRHDASRRFADEIAGLGTLSIATTPPGAEVFLFRYREHAEVAADGGPRLVPVPVQESPPAVLPGTVALEVAEDVPAAAGTADARRGDVVLSLGGEAVADLAPAEARRRAAAGGAARRWRDGAVDDVVLPPVARARVTATPLLVSPACRAGTAPFEALRLGEGSYLALVRLPGHEPLRRVVRVGANHATRKDLVLLPDGATPPGFVRVDADSAPRGTFWIQEREVTAAEYLEFLNDPATLREIDASPRPIRYPRNRSTLDRGGHWARGADGRYAIADDWRPDWPAVGVSWDDASAYVRWFAARFAASRKDLVPALPDFDEFLAASLGGDTRSFCFGDRFLPSYAKYCYSRPTPGVEDVLSYPVDEAPCGAFDLAGSATEWLDAWYTPGNRRAAAGNWSWGKVDMFKPWGGFGLLPHVAGDEFGFRMALRPAEGGR